MEVRFARAARHSRMVRMLRVAVPAAVVLAMASIVAVSVFNPFRILLPKLPVDMGNLVVSGTKITMESPHLAGFSTDQRPYEMWAKAAIQDLTDPDHVELKTLRAKVMMEDKSTVTMDARTGYFDSKQQMLDLRKDIFLQSSTGYEARMTQAYVDINKGTVTSDEHVDVKLLNGTLTADKLRIFNGGEIVRFEGNVVMNLDNLRCRGRAGRRRPRRRLPRRVPSPANPPTPNDVDDEVHTGSVDRGRHAARPCLRSRLWPAADSVRAQSTMSGVPNAMQGFSQNRDQPIKIEAASLEMRDKKKEATFSGNVKVVQGDTTMTSKIAGRVLRIQPRRRRRPHLPQPRERRRRQRRPRRCSRRPRAPAAVRRSAGWKPRAASSSRKRTRSSPARPRSSTPGPISSP